MNVIHDRTAPPQGLDRAPSPSLNPPSMAWKKLAAWAGVVAASTAVFALYARPDFLLTVADLVWTCF